MDKIVDTPNVTVFAICADKNMPKMAINAALLPHHNVANSIEHSCGEKNSKKHNKEKVKRCKKKWKTLGIVLGWIWDDNQVQLFHNYHYING